MTHANADAAREAARQSTGQFGAQVHGTPEVSLEPMPQIELYESPDGAVRLDVRSDSETVWLTETQMAELFDTTRQNINLHLNNVYGEGEVDPESTRKDFLQVRQEGGREVKRQVVHHSLDAVLSVGYRVRSSRATQFRRWSNDVLRRYILTGSAVNERRLAELGALTSILSHSRDEHVAGISDVVRRYTQDFDLLNAYDRGTFDDAQGLTPTSTLALDEAREVIAAVRSQFPGDELFGAERPGGGLDAVLAQVEQTSFGQPLYPTVEDRAANLIYLTVKNHPLSDGNKRSAVALASYYLEKNGAQPLPENTLASLALVAASSVAEQKDQIVGVLRTVLARNNVNRSS